jgi:GT2 family glycosyltransferase
LEGLKVHPSISVIVVGDRGEIASLSRTISSLQRQIYPNWEAIVQNFDLAGPSELTWFLEQTVRKDVRVRLAARSLEAQQSSVKSLCEEVAGDFVLLLPQGDVLSDDALLTIAQQLQDERPGIIYFDDDCMDLDGAHIMSLRSAHFRPDFDYDLLLASDYIGSRFVFRRELVDEIGGFRDELGRSQFFDALLRMIERLKPRNVVHIARVLCHKCDETESSGATGDENSTASAIEIVQAHLSRMARNAAVLPHNDALGRALNKCRRIRWALPEPAPRISIIIPTRDRADLLNQCLQSVLASQPHYPSKFDIIVVDNDSCEPETLALFEACAMQASVRILPFKGRFNWSSINNFAAAQADGDILLFLNNDTVVLTPDWARELASIAWRREVGAVGARLLYEDGTLQHAGVLMGVSGGAVHEGVGELPAEGGYRGRTALQRNVLAVTGACMATRADLFHEAGGFDEVDLRVEFNDTDYCLRLRDLGYSIVYTPFATLYHFESKSRGFSKTKDEHARSFRERTILASRWQKYFDRDPFYNAHFDRFSRPFSRLRPLLLMDDGLAPAEPGRQTWHR